MKIYKVSVQWTMVAEVKVQANSLEEAMQKVNAASFGLPEGWYLDDSFTVDEEDTKRLNP